MSRTTFINTLAGLSLYLSTLQFYTLANPAAAQMQYSGSVIISKTSVTVVTVTEEIADIDEEMMWPTSSVAGMNLDQLISYEMGHNFELRPSSTSDIRASEPLPSSPPHNNAVDKDNNNASSTSTTSTRTFVYLPLDIPTVPATTTIDTDTASPSDHADLSAREYRLMPKPGNRASQAVLPMKECAAMDMSGEDNVNVGPRPDNLPLGRRNLITLLTPPAPTAPAASHSSYAAMIYSLAAPYLPRNHAVRNMRARRIGAGLEPRQFLPAQDPNAPYGALLSTSGFAVYTDKVAWDQAVYTWGLQGINGWTCLGPAPLFVATTMKPSTTTPPPGAVVTTKATAKVVGETKDKKMKNANGGVRFEKKPGEGVVIKRVQQEQVVKRVDVVGVDVSETVPEGGTRTKAETVGVSGGLGGFAAGRGGPQGGTGLGYAGMRR